MRTPHDRLGSRSGFTMVELLSSILIATILMLTIGTVSAISVKTNAGNMYKLQIHADITHGFKLIQKRFRESEYYKDPDAPGAPWDGFRLPIVNKTGNDSVFGLYRDIDSVDFVYLPDADDETQREVILSVPNPADLTLNIIPSLRSITVEIEGTKNEVPFEMETTILRRRAS